MHSLIEVVRLSKQYVHGSRPDHEVEELIAHIIGMKRFDLYVRHDRPMEESELARIREGIASLKAGVPLAYVTNTVHFWKSDFYITPDVLIPRPETECIVEHAIRLILEHGYTSLIDVCTGSGCIGLSIKRERPELHVILSDLSKKACVVAQKNAFGLDVLIRQGDLLENIRPGEVELIVSNPPYLSRIEWDTLDSSVKNFEPKEALLGGTSGTELYDRLIQEAVHKQAKAIILEIGATQREAVTKLCTAAGALSVTAYPDLSDKDRVVVAVFC